jgi:hypothetical protein
MRMLSGIILLSALLAILPLTVIAKKRSYNITVDAGQIDRYNSVVSFQLPKDAVGKLYQLRDKDGKIVALQLDGKGNASFILDELKSGTKRAYKLEEIKEKKGNRDDVKVERGEGDIVNITIDNHPVIRYQGGKGILPRPDIKPIFLRGGYIQSVFTPSGKVVTDDYPLNHVHHHGIWFAWTKTVFEDRKPDFWNMGEGSGTVEFEALDSVWSGPVHGGFTARHRHVDLSAPQPKGVLGEEWIVNVYRAGKSTRPYWVFDLTSTQHALSSNPLILPQHLYGGLGFRGNRQWDGKENTFFLTSEDKTRTDGHGTRARWCHIGGKVDGQLAGIAILGHPDNFRAPQPMRIHPEEPFFCFAPPQLGESKIDSTSKYISRYRFIVYDGEPDKAELDRIWNDYADPAKVTVEVK